MELSVGAPLLSGTSANIPDEPNASSIFFWNISGKPVRERISRNSVEMTLVQRWMPAHVRSDRMLGRFRAAVRDAFTSSDVMSGLESPAIARL